MSFFKRLLITTGLMLLFVQQASSQKHIEYKEQAWLGYFNQSRFTDKSGLWVDLHFRTTDSFIKQTTVTIARLAYIYYITDDVRLMAGYAYATKYSAPVDIPEHRPWQQIFWIEKKNRFNLSQSIRLEERYRRKVADGALTDGYDFNWRFRYNFTLTIPLTSKTVKPKTTFLYLNNEIHINAGENIMNNYFDQNRLFAGLGYQFTPSLNAHLGYLFVFQQEAAVNQFVHINAIRLFVVHSLDFRNQETGAQQN
jgi:hypothetical protein